MKKSLEFPECWQFPLLPRERKYSPHLGIKARLRNLSAKFGNQNRAELPSSKDFSCMANFGMENLHSDGFHTEEASTNCDLKQVSSNELPGRDSAATTKPVFFPFPFPPYDIQEDFMRTLFQVLDNGEVGIFESPTGTVGADKWQFFRGLRLFEQGGL